MKSLTVERELDCQSLEYNILYICLRTDSVLWIVAFSLGKNYIVLTCARITTDLIEIDICFYCFLIL